MSAVTHAFEIGDHVVIVGNYRPVTGVGTVDSIATGETYDVWVRFTDSVHSANATYPFRAEELALALDVEGAEALMTALATEPIPTVTRPAHPSATRVGLGILLGLALGIITGVLAAPANVQTIEVRSTVTHAAPPVCLNAARAGAIKDDFADTAAAHHDAVLQHTIDAFEAQVYGNTDAMLAAQKAANDAKLLRDEAQRAADDARESFGNHAAACETWKVAQRTTERVAK